MLNEVGFIIKLMKTVLFTEKRAPEHQREANLNIRLYRGDYLALPVRKGSLN